MSEAMLCLLSLSASGAVLAAVAALLAAVLRQRATGRFLTLLWAAVLLRMVCPVGPGGLMEALLGRTAEPAALQQNPTSAGATSGGVRVRLEEGEDAVSFEQDTPFSPPGLVLLWGGTAAGLLLWRVAGYVALSRRLLRPARPAGAREQAVLRELCPKRAPLLLVTPAIGAPLLLRPGLLLLPEEEFEEWELSLMLRHELAHRRRRDLPLKWAAAAVPCLHWFNPAAWLAFARLEQACELACDQEATASLDRAARARYGRLLLRLSSGGALPGGTAAGMASHKARLKERFVWIMSEHKKTGRGLLAAAGAAVLLCAAGLGVYRAEQPETTAANGLTAAENIRVLKISEPNQGDNPVIRVVQPGDLPAGERSGAASAPVGDEAGDAEERILYQQAAGSETEEPVLIVAHEEENAAQAGLAERVYYFSAPQLQLAWPLQTDGEVRLSARFGERTHPVSGTVIRHTGLDIPMEQGAEVLAAADGEVTFADWDGARGYVVRLAHGTATTEYRHLSEVSVQVGDVVAVGDNIGAAGATGNATGPHLHFEVTLDGEPVDPLPMLDATPAEE
ncbi:MAG: peptidoglycan DD-metalloendopeptidase family protein [Clostridia bacterium]|nr:peptidoglycan DD-metalloendopeptidase family protein [Clostridia bacterium]